MSLNEKRQEWNVFPSCLFESIKLFKSFIIPLFFQLKAEGTIADACFLFIRLCNLCISKYCFNRYFCFLYANSYSCLFFYHTPFFLRSTKIGMYWKNGVFNLDFCISICIILICRLFVSRHTIAFKCTENRPVLCFEIICFDLCT